MPNHDLTAELLLREAFDVTTGALKTIPSSSTSFSIELDAADGDNITAKSDVALVTTTAVTSCVGMKSVALYVEPGAAATVKLQVSSLDSGSVFMDVPSGSIANDPTDLKATSVLSICARRIKVVVVSGSPTFQLVMQNV